MDSVNCPICLDPLTTAVSLSNCAHKFNFKCAMDIFGEMKAGQCAKPGPCPLCNARTTSYLVDHQFRDLVVRFLGNQSSSSSSKPQVLPPPISHEEATLKSTYEALLATNPYTFPRTEQIELFVSLSSRLPRYRQGPLNTLLCHFKTPEPIKRLIKLAANLNAPFPDNTTPFMRLIANLNAFRGLNRINVKSDILNWQVKIIKIFLRYRADPNTKTLDQMTAHDSAGNVVCTAQRTLAHIYCWRMVNNGDEYEWMYEGLKTLKAYNPDLNIADENGLKPIDYLPALQFPTAWVLLKYQ